MNHPVIEVSAVGLDGKDVFLAHERGNWGPESQGSDHANNRFTLSGKVLKFPPDFLEEGEEFKIVVPVSGEREARKIYAERMKQGVHVNTRFDFDANYNTFWLLASNYPVIRPGEWNQNNVFFYKKE